MKLTNFKLAIGIPLSFHMIPSAFFDSFIVMEKPPFTYLRTSSGNLDEMRNAIVEDAFTVGATHLMMMDTDQIYHHKTIPQLLSHKLPVVGTLVYRRYPPFDPLMLKGKIGEYKSIAEWEPDSLVEVDATGTGCLLFEMDVFRRIPRPWFAFRKDLNGNPIGEDIGFCQDIRNAGFRIYVDTSVPAGHLSQMQITEGTWRLYSRLQEAKNRYREEHGILMADNPA